MRKGGGFGDSRSGATDENPSTEDVQVHAKWQGVGPVD